jgi:nucleoid DNA-binding protein/cell division protein FtsN
MIKQEIIEKISKYFKLTTYDAEKIYDDIFLEIINGVKKDNIADITNLGEFIIKYNNGDSDHKKTVEFLPTLSLEDEINQRSFEEQRSFEPAPFVSYASTENEEQVENVPEVKKEAEEITDELKDAADIAGDMSTSAEDSEMTGDKSSVEDEIKKKREEILNKITIPREEIKDEVLESKEEITKKDKPAVIPVVPDISRSLNEEPVTEIFGANDNNDNIEETFEKTSEEIKSGIKEAEDIQERSFSDLFTEVSAEEKSAVDSANKTTNPPVENVIPPTAVELHNQITGDKAKNSDYLSSLNTLPYATANGNGAGNGNGESFEHRLQDNSYYIWYKDSEPNTSDTQTMSYEYELLYQATKEAEYKSKLRIYVTTFIMFFSIVLILLIFSPVIYKYFFSPAEDQNTEEVSGEVSSDNTESGNSESEKTTTENQASLNTLPENNTPPVTNTGDNTQSQSPVTQEQPKQEQPVQEQPKQEEPVKQNTESAPPPETQTQPNTSVPPGVTKSTMGWLDDHNKVIYVQLDNGKFTIQESAWDSDAKANKRLSTVASIVPGLAGNVVKVDLGSKGTWYRARFGEFASLEEARAKAEELRNKEKTRLHALLLSFFLYA